MRDEINKIMHYGFRIERTAKKIKQTLQKRFAALNSEITVDQWVILDCLFRAGELSQNELADYTYKDAPTVTRIIDLLSKKELLSRQNDDTDRRRFKICLTEKGRECVRKHLPIVQDVRRQGRNGLSDTDFDRMEEVLEKIFRNFD